MDKDSSIQRIVRLTPLGTILALIESRVQPVTALKSALADAQGRMLAEAVVAAERPLRPIALRDGYAVNATELADAGPYAPVPLSSIPLRVDVGDPLPGGADAVAPLDAITLRGDRAEAVAAISPGEGALPAGGDATPRMPLRRAGEMLRAIDIAIMAAAGVGTVTIRAPRIRIARCGAAGSPMLDAALDILFHAVAGAGGRPLGSRDDLGLVEDALSDAEADAVIGVGGTGSARNDDSVKILARLGRVDAHGIAVSPGETAAVGCVGKLPVLLMPGRIDAVLAVWLLIGRHLMAKLAGGSVEDASAMRPLKRKVASAIGLTELIPVGFVDGMAEPLASGYLSLQSLARSDGWIVISADSEGFQAGTQVAVRQWP